MCCTHKSTLGLWPHVWSECTCKKTWFFTFFSWFDIRRGTEVCIIPTGGGRRTLLRKQFWAHLTDFPFLLPLLLHDGERERKGEYFRFHFKWLLPGTLVFLAPLLLLQLHVELFLQTGTPLLMLFQRSFLLFSRAKVMMGAVVLLCLSCPEDLLVCFLQVSELSDLFSSTLFRALQLLCPSDLMEITEFALEKIYHAVLHFIWAVSSFLPSSSHLCCSSWNSFSVGLLFTHIL